MTNVTSPTLLNGNGKTTWWILGLLTTAIIGAGSGWVGTTTTQLRIHGERIAVMEAQNQDTREQLQRINRKLDQLLDHPFRRP